LIDLVPIDKISALTIPPPSPRLRGERWYG